MLTDEEREKVNTLLALDEASLDQECLRHPRRMLRWVLLEADAKQEVSLAKARLDLAEARVKRAARLDPARFGLKDKPTVGDLAEAVTLSPEYQEAQTELQAAEHHADQVKGVVTALTEKRRAIERLVELKQIDYYSEPRPKVGAEAMNSAAKRAARGPLERNGE
jgi:hypothetical protein